MASCDIDMLQIGEAVQEFLSNILEQVIRNVVEIQTNERRRLIHQLADNAEREATITTTENKIRCSDQHRCENQGKEFRNIKTYDMLEGGSDIDTDVGSNRTEVETGPASVHLTTGEDFSKCSYLEKRVSLYSSINMKTGMKKKYIEDMTSMKNMMAEYTRHKSNDCVRGKESNHGKHEPDINLQKETETKSFYSLSNENTNRLRIDTTMPDVNVLTNHLEDCAISYGGLQDQSIEAMRSEFIDECIPNHITDAKVRVKADELRGKVFPKFSKVKKRKTKYGKIKIYYCGELPKDEQKRIIKEAEELLKYVRDKNLEEKRQREELERETESFGTRIRKFFRRLSCITCRRNE